MKPIINTKEKDRQSQVRAVFALMAILCGDEWLTLDEIKERMKNKGFPRCQRTIKRLINLLRSMNFNLLCQRSSTPYKYKGHKKKIFLAP